MLGELSLAPKLFLDKHLPVGLKPIQEYFSIAVMNNPWCLETLVVFTFNYEKVWGYKLLSKGFRQSVSLHRELIEDQAMLQCGLAEVKRALAKLVDKVIELVEQKEWCFAKLKKFNKHQSQIGEDLVYFSKRNPLYMVRNIKPIEFEVTTNAFQIRVD